MNGRKQSVPIVSLTAVVFLCLAAAPQNPAPSAPSPTSLQSAMPPAPSSQVSPAAPSESTASEQPPGPGGLTTTSASQFSGSVPAAVLLRVPVSGVVPGARAVAPEIKNPLENDPEAATRGMRSFDTFNCSGCHAANGAGGMGPALSDDSWIYRSSPANIYLTIVQGRSKGMPAFGTLIPDRMIWELVSYIQNIAEKPSGQFGKTVSLEPQSPDRQQVSANRLQTPTPWRYTEKFSNGQRPE
jgi:cytochrome c oxidase cbb3-type subunit 3